MTLGSAVNHVLAMERCYLCRRCTKTELEKPVRCRGCGSFGPFVGSERAREQRRKVFPPPRVASAGIARASSLAGSASGENESVQEVSLEDVSETEGTRIETRIPSLDTVLGGGAVTGTAILIGGEPGVGKSTLLTQVAARMALHDNVVYGCGEEAVERVKMRAIRLGLARAKHVQRQLFLQAETRLEDLLRTIEKRRPILTIVDSVQSYWSENEMGSPGKPSQVSFVAKSLVETVQRLGGLLFLVCQVRKDNVLAGPRAIEHLVDVSLFLERAQVSSNVIVLTAHKNRHGTTTERGLFLMEEQGLMSIDEADVAYPPPTRLLGP